MSICNGVILRPLSSPTNTSNESTPDLYYPQAAFREEPEMSRVALDAVAPDFTLPDFSGNPVSLSDFRDRKHVLLVFNRTFA